MERKIGLWLLVTVAGALAAESVKAGGNQIPMDVTITSKPEPWGPALLTAKGAVGSVRNLGTNALKEIGCRLEPSQDGVVVFCWAFGATTAPVDVSCTTTDPEMVKVARSINGDSLIQFSVYIDSRIPPPDTFLDVPVNDCTSILVENASKYSPK